MGEVKLTDKNVTNQPQLTLPVLEEQKILNEKISFNNSIQMSDLLDNVDSKAKINRKNSTIDSMTKKSETLTYLSPEEALHFEQNYTDKKSWTFATVYDLHGLVERTLANITDTE